MNFEIIGIILRHEERCDVNKYLYDNLSEAFF